MERASPRPLCSPSLIKETSHLRLSQALVWLILRQAGVSFHRSTDGVKQLRGLVERHVLNRLRSPTTTKDIRVKVPRHNPEICGVLYVPTVYLRPFAITIRITIFMTQTQSYCASQTITSNISPKNHLSVSFPS